MHGKKRLSATIMQFPPCWPARRKIAPIFRRRKKQSRHGASRGNKRRNFACRFFQKLWESIVIAQHGGGRERQVPFSAPKGGAFEGSDDRSANGAEIRGGADLSAFYLRSLLRHFAFLSISGARLETKHSSIYTRRRICTGLRKNRGRN